MTMLPGRFIVRLSNGKSVGVLDVADGGVVTMLQLEPDKEDGLVLPERGSLVLLLSALSEEEARLTLPT